MFNCSNKIISIISVILIALFFAGDLPWRELRADANIHWALGLVRHYYDGEENLVYENVSDSRLYFNFWFCM